VYSQYNNNKKRDLKTQINGELYYAHEKNYYAHI
jgi:hypothetical protein